MLPRPVHAVIFDIDGLLFDTERVYFDAMVAAAGEDGAELPLDLYLSMVGLPAPDNQARLAAHYGPAFDVARFWDASRRHYRTLLATRLCLKAGVVELLDRLDARRLPRAICTSSGPDNVRHHLAATGLAGRFDTVVARGDALRGKPHPEPYRLAAARLGVPADACLALEDSHNGVRSAAAAGCTTVMVPDMLAPTDEMHALCAHVAVDLHGVGAMLDGVAGVP